MKKYLLIGLMIITTLAACSTVEKVDAGLPEGFDVVSVDKDNIANYAEVLRHKETGCHYLTISGGSGVAMQQMLIEKNGISVPYCK